MCVYVNTHMYIQRRRKKNNRKHYGNVQSATKCSRDENVNRADDGISYCISQRVRPNALSHDLARFWNGTSLPATHQQTASHQF